MGASYAKVAAVAPTKSETEDYWPVYNPADGPFATADGTSEAKIVYAKTGLASAEGTPATTVPALLLKAKEGKADKIALRVERGLPEVVKGGRVPPVLPADQWTTWTWGQYYDESYTAAKAFISLGMQQHDSVNIFGFNSPEWLMAQNAAIFAGGKVAGIYPTDTPEQVQFKANHSGSSILVLEDSQKLEDISKLIDAMPKVKAIIVWACAAPEGGKITRADGSTVKVLTWAEMLKLGEAEENKSIDERLFNMKPGHCCALIYTSGTTGNPKAVMITHDNIIFETSCVLEMMTCVGNEACEERIISYLPLSHVAGMMVDIVAPIYMTANSPAWCSATFARPYDLKLGSLPDRLRFTRPTLFLGVPRVWEKIAEKMKAVGAKTKGTKKKIADWAKNKSLTHQMAKQMGGDGRFPSRYGMANKLLSKIKAALGLDACKFGFTGAAPITTETLEYFGSLGIQINELYGMSECTGSTTFSTDEAHVWGSCGFAMNGTQVKCFIVDPKDFNIKKECPLADSLVDAPESVQGEICFRGRHIMMGYLANPDLGQEHVDEITKKCAEAVDADGWLHSGDKGLIDKRGMVKITGRYKELIIGSGGENIAPVPIENGIKKAADGISNIMMVGDQRKFNVAIVTLKAQGATGDLPGTDDLAGAALEVNPETKTISGACKDEKWIKYITDAIQLINKDQTPPCRIQRFTILPADFSVESAELTPTLKLKRGVVEKKWSSTIESMYAEGAKGTFFPALEPSA